jgi:hypothetical protein
LFGVFRRFCRRGNRLSEPETIIYTKVTSGMYGQCDDKTDLT